MNIRISFSIFACLLFASYAKAQTGVTLKFRKDKPAQLLAYERLYDRNNTKISKNKLRKRSDFTDAEVEEIFDRLDKEEKLLPKALRNSDKASLQHYVVYQLSDFNLIGYGFSLIWIPWEDNKHMPADMQPPTRDGSVFYTYTKHLSFDGKDRSGVPLVKAGTAVGSNLEPINTSVADMSQFTGRTTGGAATSSSGRKPLDMSSTKSSDARLAATAVKEYDAMYARLQQLDNEYDIEIQKIRKQIEKDNKSGVQANLFMKNERRTAQSKLDEVHRIIKYYLDKYDRILTEENKETLKGWNEGTPTYVPI